MNNAPPSTRCGFAALIGAPNAGKSTLMNALVGSKVSIVTPKVQTTRARVRGIAMHGAAQVIFIDTPGIFTARKRLDRAMVHAAWDGAGDGDVVVLVHDAARARIDNETLRIAEKLKAQSGGGGGGGGKPGDRPGKKSTPELALVLNKIDLTRRDALMARADTLSRMADFAAVFMVSSTRADGVADLLAWLAGRMPPSPYYFDPDDLSDMPNRLLAAEIMREKLFMNLHEELPYHLTVEAESWKARADGSAEVRVVILVGRASHKPMVLGKGGRTLGRIGRAARLELEAILGHRVHLFSHVKHASGWMDDPQRYRAMGLDFNA